MKDAICPCCGTEVVAKCGQMVVWHFAHKASNECDRWSDGETDWHLRWKTHSPIERTEVIMGPHRADAVGRDGRIIEYQRSSISWEDMRAREEFYGRMMWVFDVADAYQAGRLSWQTDRSIWQQADNVGHPKVRIKWMHPRRSILACRRRVFLDIGGDRLLAVGHLAREYIDWSAAEPGRTIKLPYLSGYGWLWKRDEFIEEFLADVVEHEEVPA